MKISDLFEEQDFYDTWVGFGLVITDDFTEEDAINVAEKVAEQSHGELDDYQEFNDPMFTDPEEVPHMEFRIYIPEDNIELPRKFLRRLSRGKPRFEVYYFNVHQGGTVTEY